jgi:SAM-dependent methyltransferase
MSEREHPPLIETRSEDYRSSHLGAVADDYDDSLFSEGSYNHEVWKREKKLLDEFVARWAPKAKRYLDFACGTGRVLTFLEGRFSESVGLDISPDMLSQARKRGARSRLVRGDVTREPEILEGCFDCISAFRFFLNAEPALRAQAMSFLVSRLCDEDSVLIFNVHGNRVSTYGLSVLLKRLLLRRRHNTLSLREVRELVDGHGLQIVEWCGIHYFDQTWYDHLPRPIWRTLEAALAPLRFLRPFSVYFYFVCRKREVRAATA